MDAEQYGEYVMYAVDSLNSGLLDMGDGIISGTSKVREYVMYAVDSLNSGLLDMGDGIISGTSKVILVLVLSVFFDSNK